MSYIPAALFVFFFIYLWGSNRLSFPLAFLGFIVTALLGGLIVEALSNGQ